MAKKKKNRNKVEKEGLKTLGREPRKTALSRPGCGIQSTGRESSTLEAREEISSSGKSWKK